MLDKSFQEILYRIDNWINEGSGWVIESVNKEYVNIFIFIPLSGNTYIELPRRLKNSNIKKSDNKCCLWCHIGHLNPLKIHPERITKADKNMVNDLELKALNFLSLKKILARLKRKIIFPLMCFVMKITWFILFICQMKNLKIVWIY